MAGRGFGKTRIGVEDILHHALENDGFRYAVVAPTQGDLKKICFEGESGFIKHCPPDLIKGGDWNKSDYYMELWNGSMIQGFSAEKPDRLRGPQFHRAWCDEVSSWRYSDAWDMLEFGLRLGEDPRTIVTSTPKPVPLVKMICKTPGTIITYGSTYENEKNLAKKFLQKVKDKYEGTSLGEQELFGKLLEDIEGALWRRDMIKYIRVKDVPTLVRIVVAVDPAVTANENSDETGIVVAGMCAKGNFYILDDTSGTHSVSTWPRLAVKAFHQHHADCIVAEVNQGGDLVEHSIRNVDRNISYKQVRASRGKVVRAEPIAQLYEQGRVFHVGVLPELEDQMCSFNPTIEQSSSPDRMDAMVWALTELTGGEKEARMRVL